MLTSPYIGYSESEWPAITQCLVNAFPIPREALITIIEAAWEDIYTSSFGDSGLRIGRDIFLPAQATGVILERLIAVRLSKSYPNWRGSGAKHEKDIVCIDDEIYCFEIKTSSSKNGI